MNEQKNTTHETYNNAVWLIPTMPATNDTPHHKKTAHRRTPIHSSARHFNYNATKYAANKKKQRQQRMYLHNTKQKTYRTARN